jgi:hypothetical protein
MRVENINEMTRLSTLLEEAMDCNYGSDDWRARVQVALE